MISLAQVRRFALALDDTTEAPHHHYSSFRVAGKIFVTIPPEETHIHLFVDDELREQATAGWPEFAEKLLWGGKVVGVRVTLADADAALVKAWVRAAWAHKRPALKTTSRKKTPS